MLCDSDAVEQEELVEKQEDGLLGFYGPFYAGAFGEGVSAEDVTGEFCVEVGFEEVEVAEVAEFGLGSGASKTREEQ